jgi:hypothetical protein
MRMSLELDLALRLRPFGIPDADGFVRCSCGYL